MAIDIASLGRSKKGVNLDLDAVEQVMKARADEFVKRVKANLDRKTKDKPQGTNATRSLYQSIAPNVKVFGFKYQLIISAEEYWEVVDKGRGAGKKGPPDDAIRKWLTTKPLRLDYDKLGLKIPKRGITPAFERNARKGQIFTIKRAIKKRGIKGTKFMSKELDPFLKKLENELSVALQKDVELHLQKTITKQAPGR